MWMLARALLKRRKHINQWDVMRMMIATNEQIRLAATLEPVSKLTNEIRFVPHHCLRGILIIIQELLRGTILQINVGN